MIAEAIEKVQELTKAAVAPVVIDTGDETRVAYVIGGKVEQFDRAVSARDHELHTLGEIVRMANRVTPEDGAEDGHGIPIPIPSVWYCDDQVRLLFDDSDRDEAATFELTPSATFDRVCKLRGLEWLEQKAFVRLLRIELAGTLEPVHLLEKVRRVKFEAGSTTTGEVRRDRESIGREITQRAESSEGEIPEEVTLQVPIYSNPGERMPRPIRCAVEVDAGRGAFRLVPLPDEIDRAQALAVDSIADRLHGELKTPLIYHGRP